jgi:dTDP-4-amino-4,6-dideoxygalactose transaminase
MHQKIWLSSPHLSKQGYEMRFVKEAFDTNWVAPLGPNVDGFEREIAEYVGSGHAAALCSGTSAIHMALVAAGVADGDEVICQSLTFSATANPIIYQRAIPVFVDSDKATWNMSPQLLEQALKKHPRAKAVLVTHLYGLSADIDPIVKLCQQHGVALIEDAAESLGTTYKGRHTGSFGRFGIFSFNGNKIITTSGGGMLVSDDEAAIKNVRFWATQARDPARHYQHSQLGFNYRLSNVSAGIGRGQLLVLAERIAQKKAIFKRYQQQLGTLPGVEFMPINDWNDPNCWLSCMTLQKGGPTPLEIAVALEKQNIESRPIWKPMQLQPYYEKYKFYGDGTSQHLFETGICLPSDTKMTPEQQERVCEIIKSLF